MRKKFFQWLREEGLCHLWVRRTCPPTCNFWLLLTPLEFLLTSPSPHRGHHLWEHKSLGYAIFCSSDHRDPTLHRPPLESLPLSEWKKIFKGQLKQRTHKDTANIHNNWWVTCKGGKLWKGNNLRMCMPVHLQSPVHICIGVDRTKCHLCTARLDACQWWVKDWEQGKVGWIMDEAKSTPLDEVDLGFFKALKSWWFCKWKVLVT